MKQSTFISPEKKWFDFRWRELWEARELIYRFVHRDFVTSYKQTILGPFWFVVPPVITTLVFTVIFGGVAKIPTDGIPSFLFFLSGVILWNYFSSCLMRTSSTFSGNAGMFGKVYFPRLCVPFAILISNLLNLSIQILIFAGAFAWFCWRGTPLHPSWWMLALPLLLLLLAMLGLGVGCFVSALTTRYRDMAMVVGFGVQLWMYASCVVYPLSQVSAQYRWIVVLNPVVPIIEAWRQACFGRGVLTWTDVGLSVLMTLVICFTGLVVFKRMENTFMDTV